MYIISSENLNSRVNELQIIKNYNMNTSELAFALIYLVKKYIVKQKECTSIKFSNIRKCGHAKISSCWNARFTCNLIYLHCLCYKSLFYHIFNKDFIAQKFTSQNVRKTFFDIVVDILLIYIFHAGYVQLW